MSKWITFVDVTQSYPNANKKTCTWNIYSTTNHSFLGKIKWYAPWRQYCFFPDKYIETLYNTECLEDIAKFCRENRTTRNQYYEGVV